MERELERTAEPVLVQVQAVASIPPNPNDKRREIDIEDGAMADEIYIFTNPNEPGIKFVDASPAGVIAKLVGANRPLVYTTDVGTIDIVGWDDSINIPNRATRVRYINGSVTIRTIMVSEETLRAILKDIDKQIAEGKTTIKIDIGILHQKNNLIDDTNSILKEDKSINNIESIEKYNLESNNINQEEEFLKENKETIERYKELYNEIKNLQDKISNKEDKNMLNNDITFNLYDGNYNNNKKSNSDVDLNSYFDDMNDIGSTGFSK